MNPPEITNAPLQEFAHVRAVEEALRARKLPRTQEYYTLFSHYVRKELAALHAAVTQLEQEFPIEKHAARQVGYRRLLHDFALPPIPLPEELDMCVTSSRGLDGLLGGLEQLQLHNRPSMQALFDGVEETKRHLHAEDNDRADAVVETMLKMQQRGEHMQQELAMLQGEVTLLRQDLARQIAASERDFLTHAYNRKAWERRVQAALADASQMPLCIALIDIDHFKQINDQWGHAAGDTALKNAVSVMKNMLKGQDILGRYGGDELAVLLPKTPLKGAVTVLNLVRMQVKQASNEALFDGHPVTISVGVAEVAQSGVLALQDVVAKADKALYAAKHAGRDCVQA